MTQYRVVTKRIVSPDNKLIAEAKSVVAASDDKQTEVSQSVSVTMSSDTICSISSSSSSTSYAESVSIDQ